jgi:hypothetical protein
MRPRRKQRLSGVGSQDRQFAALIVLGVTFVLLLAGFCGPSDDLRLPDRSGWIYIGVVVILAMAAFIWLMSANASQKRSSGYGWKRNNGAQIGGYKRR